MAKSRLKKRWRSFTKGLWNWPLYLLYRLLKALLRRLGDSKKARLAQWLGRWAYRLDRPHRQVVEANIRFLLGGRLAQSACDRAARGVYPRFVRYLFDVIEHDYRNREQLDALVSVENDRVLTEAIARNERVIILAAHYGHWELIGQYLCAFYRPFVGIAQRFGKSPKLTEELQGYRHRAGMEILPRKGAMRKIAQALRSGKMVGFLPDQATKNGKPARLFGHPIRWLDSASRLARQFDATIVPTFITTDDFHHYRLFFLDPIRPDSAQEKEQDIERMVQAEVGALEQAIVRNPEEYFWFHKRFKYDHPAIYDEANPSTKSASS